jgi:nucleoside-diphosphate-sugar epimerase
MKAHLHHRPSSRSLALALLAVALMVAATIAAAFTREADTEAARANSASKPLLLIAGAPGETGTLIADLAAEESFAVRKPSGDMRNARTAHDSVRGVEFVICGLAGQVWEGPETPEFVGYRAFVNLVNAARTNGVRHFVLISSVWAGVPPDESYQARAGLVRPWRMKAEEYLKGSGVPYTIIGPGILRSEPAGASGLRVVHRESYQPSSVARADVARVAIDALRNPIARNKSFAVFNDAAVSPDTWRKELYAVRRDAPVGAAGIGAAGQPDANRIVVPVSRERLMIEDEAVTGETPSVGWTAPSASSQ